MANDYTIFVGTIGGGLSFSPDGGDSWNRVRAPLVGEGNVRALSVYPDSNRILVGTDDGVFRSDDKGMSWQNLDAPTSGLQVWSVAVDPVDPDIVFVGTRPEGYRSRDGGKSWQKLSMGVNMDCPIGTPRTTNIIVDPRDHRTVWAGIEVDGVYKSLDGGDSWLHLPDLGPDPFHGDIHGMALKSGPESAVYCTSPFGIATSTDEGESWDYHEFAKFRETDTRSYCRGMVIRADNPDVMFVGNSDTIPGLKGRIQRTRDAGRSWESVDLPVEPNSLIYWFATNPSIPNVIVAASIYGYVYASNDGGDNWEKLDKEFGEIRSVAVLPS